MVYRRSRRRYRFGRRYRRRLYRRKVFRRRRRYRRRGRKSASRGSTVSFTTDYPIQHCSYIPVDNSHQDTGTTNNNTYGVPRESYPAWSLSILPTSLAYLPGNAALYITGAGPADLAKLFRWNNHEALNSALTHTAGYYSGMRKYQCDYPNYTNLHAIEAYYDLGRLFAIYDRVRINRVQITLTVPERTEGGPNHHLYIMYNKGRGFTASDSEDTCSYLLDDLHSASQDELDALHGAMGLNWLWRQEDLINACSRNGVRNAKSGWHIRELAYNKPVTISWVPRHTRIQSTSTHFIDKINDAADATANVVTNYATSKKLVSSSVSTDFSSGSIDDYVWYTGPVVRLLDADLGPAGSYSPTTAKLFETYGIRAHMYCSCTFTAFNQVDPLIQV